MNKDKYLVLDLEATCDDGIKNYPKSKKEIIEIGAVIADIDGLVYEEFDVFVKPVIIPILSDFCKELTTITQDQVDNGLLIVDAFNELEQFWLNMKNKYPELVGWGSWGYFDKGQIDHELQRINYTQPFSISFSNVRHYNFSDLYRYKKALPRKVGLGKAISQNSLSFTGTAHRAIDDVKNIAQILPIIFKENSW